MLTSLCPCGSQQHYTDCCGTLHRGKLIAASAEQLMRSRYSAFALNHIDYIVQTTLPAQQALLDIPAISAWSQQNDWLGLTVNSTKHNGTSHAQVNFSAQFKDKNNTIEQAQIHQELSSFVKIAEKWYFLDPTVQCTLSLKSTCLCGSSKKFKRCCAPFLGMV